MSLGPLMYLYFKCQLYFIMYFICLTHFVCWTGCWWCLWFWSYNKEQGSSKWLQPLLHYITCQRGQGREGFSRQEEPSAVTIGRTHVRFTARHYWRCSRRGKKTYGGRARAQPGVSASAFKEQRLLTSHLQHREGIPSQRAASSSKCHHCKSRQCPPAALRVGEEWKMQALFDRGSHCSDVKCWNKA